MLFGRNKTQMVTADTALAGRAEAIVDPAPHFVTGAIIDAPPAEGEEEIILGLGCFWGAERVFWNTPGVTVTAVGYAGGFTPNPTYEEVCSGKTGHTEVVRVVFRPEEITTTALLAVFWQAHDPTQGMQQGNDIGTQYRSAIYTTDRAQALIAKMTHDIFQERLTNAGYGAITTEIAEAGPLYYAEDYHQQYLAKHIGGYCGLGGTGVSCPIGLDTD
jgi:peptide-methionine (S)-S-oxide reductase